MPINVNEAIVKIKKAGSKNVRAVPMPGQSVTSGDYQIEILEDGSWAPTATGLPKKLADDLISQATSRLICG